MTKQSHSADYYLGVHKDAFRRYRLFNEVHVPGTINRLAELAVATDMHVLEVGCGIGDTACYLARNVVPDGHVTAFDQAGELIDIAKQEASDAGISNVTFVCSRAQDFDFGSDRFDFAHSRYVLSYSPDAMEIVGSIFGALKPAGFYLGEEIAQLYVKHGETAWYETMGRWFTALIESGGGNANYGLDQLPSDMLSAGFEDLHVTGFWPVEDQEKIVEMLRLALSKEMKESLTSLGLATESEIDAVVAAMETPERDFVISAAAVVQVVGYKLAQSSR